VERAKIWKAALVARRQLSVDHDGADGE
jgi:hypothetical protein